MRKAGVPSILVAVAVLAVGVIAEAQQPKKVPLIGFLGGPSLVSIKPLADTFRQGLRELGYVEGQSLAIEWRSAEGVNERLPNLVAELVKLKVDVILTRGTPATQAAKNATQTIPIVMTGGSDPLGTGLVTSLAHPAGNVTGLTDVYSDLGGKQLELLKEASSKVSRVVVLWDPANPGNTTWLGGMKVAAGALNLTLRPVEVHGPNDLEPAFSAIKREPAHALSVLSNAVTTTYRTWIVDLAGKSRLPAMYPDRESVEAGGLMSYAANLSDMYRRAATYVDKILKGSKPADLPVEQPTKFEFIINLKAAKQIGLTIPPNVLARADKVIK
jgi:ABC-type uncharacterized transport system substrate-binding protein